MFSNLGIGVLLRAIGPGSLEGRWQGKSGPSLTLPSPSFSLSLNFNSYDFLFMKYSPTSQLGFWYHCSSGGSVVYGIRISKWQSLEDPASSCAVLEKPVDFSRPLLFYKIMEIKCKAFQLWHSQCHDSMYPQHSLFLLLLSLLHYLIGLFLSCPWVIHPHFSAWSLNLSDKGLSILGKSFPGSAHVDPLPLGRSSYRGGASDPLTWRLEKQGEEEKLSRFHAGRTELICPEDLKEIRGRHKRTGSSVSQHR